LQYGVDCNADSPPAPAPTAATELFVMERRRQLRRLLQAGGLGADPLASTEFGGLPPAPGAKAGRATTCRGYYRTVTILTSATLLAAPPGIPDTAAGYADPDWSLSLSPCGALFAQLNLPVSATQWKEDARGAAAGSSAPWCSNWPQLVASSPLAAAAAAAGLNLTLRSTADPAAVAGGITQCSGALGESAGAYAERGMGFIVFGLALAGAGLFGARREAEKEGRPGAAEPLATLKAAWASYGATASGGWGGGVAMGSAGAGARRRAPDERGASGET